VVNSGPGASMGQAEKLRGLGAATLAAISVLATTMAPARAEGIVGYPAQVEAYDPREVALLPRYCIYTQSFRDHVRGGNDKTMIDGWYARLGPTFHALHHFCWGMMKTNRGMLLANDRQTRDFYLSAANVDFDYVIERAPADFVLLPEILAKKGENLIRLGNGPLGMIELQRAAELKPDYWPPYAYMSDYYRELGDQAKAREVLEAGLQRLPESQSLRTRLAELDSISRRKKATR
jgi:tetratricopeptide (TPR) repeat protein